MRTIFRLYQHINILSIDIVAGAVISALFFSRIFRVEIKSYGLIALGLTVWIIYTVDHLRDAKRIRHQASTVRHRFHQQNFRPLILFLSIAILIDAITIFFIRKQVFEWGVILSIGVMFYLIFQKSLRFLKELFIASLYTAGVLLLSITVTPIQAESMHYLLIVQFGSIAWINLVLFSWFDHAFDQKDDQNSFVTLLGKHTSRIFLHVLCALNFCLTIVLFFIGAPFVPVIILMSMNGTLILIFVFRTVLENDDAYRLIGDAVFLFPVFFLI